MVDVLIALAIGVLLVGLSAGFAIWRPIHDVGADFWRIPSLRVWSVIWAVCGVVVEGILLLFMHFGDRNIIANRDFPDLYEYTALSILVAAFFYFVTESTDPLDNDEHIPHWWARRIVPMSSRSCALVVGFFIYILINSPMEPIVLSVDSAIAAGTRLLSVPAVLGTTFVFYGSLWKRFSEDAQSEFRGMSHDLVQKLTALEESTMKEEIDQRLHDDFAASDPITPIARALYEEALTQPDVDTRKRRLAQLVVMLFHFRGAKRFLCTDNLPEQ